jgi:hypothetical protein
MRYLRNDASPLASVMTHSTQMKQKLTSIHLELVKVQLKIQPTLHLDYVEILPISFRNNPTILLESLGSTLANANGGFAQCVWQNEHFSMIKEAEFLRQNLYQIFATKGFTNFLRDAVKRYYFTDLEKSCG